MNMFYKIALLLSILASAFSAPSSDKSAFKDVEELGGFVEGDMVLRDHNRNGLIDEQYMWPGGLVIYELDRNFSVSELSKIYAGWAELSNTTCITFRQRDSDADYVFVQKGAEGSGCYSEVGKIGGMQVLNLEPRCIERHGTVIHEMLHAIGFYHEQSRPDRDDYVTIVWEKIEPGLEHNFDKYNTSEVTTFGAPYDYGSVLHYPATGFSIDGTPTITTKIPGVVIGQREKISQIDAGKVRIMYSCPDEWKAKV